MKKVEFCEAGEAWLPSPDNIYLRDEVFASFPLSCFGYQFGELPTIDLSSGTLSFTSSNSTTTLPIDVCILGVIGLGAFFALPVVLSERNINFLKQRVETGPILLKNLQEPILEDLHDLYRKEDNSKDTSYAEYNVNSVYNAYPSTGLPAASNGIPAASSGLPGPQYPANVLSGGKVQSVMEYEEGWTGHLFPNQQQNHLTPQQKYQLEVEQYNRHYQQKLAEYEKHIAPYKQQQQPESQIQNGGQIQDGVYTVEAKVALTDDRFGNEELIQQYNYKEPIDGIEKLFLQEQELQGPEQPAATPIIYQAGSQVQQSSDVGEQNKERIVPVYPANSQVKVAPVYPASSLTATANSPKTTAKPASRPQPPQKEAEIIRGQSAAEAPEFLVHSAKYELMNQEIENEFDMNSSLLENQDYQDIDYTSGGLVSYHISLTKKRKKKQLFK